MRGYSRLLKSEPEIEKGIDEVTLRREVMNTVGTTGKLHWFVAEFGNVAVSL